jgi:serine/threonine protein kinase
MSFATDTSLGPYKIIALIGSGGMGEVYRARDTRLLRDVALKVLPASFTNDPDRLRRFEQEARAVAALNHPNIVSVYDVGAAEGVHYIVSELLEGETLRQRITPTGMPARRAIELAVQLANGLAAAHEQGIVHRDLKPENLFITRAGRLKILDFGLAKLRRERPIDETAGSQTAAHTEVGQVLGTAGYMSPEQVKGEPADHRSDIFSFGSILYEMLNGQRAFKRNTSAETMTAILNEERSLRSRPAQSLPRSSASCGIAWRSSRASASSLRTTLRLILNLSRAYPEQRPRPRQPRRTNGSDQRWPLWSCLLRASPSEPISSPARQTFIPSCIASRFVEGRSGMRASRQTAT